MISNLYIEDGLQTHPRVQAIMTRFPDVRKIICKQYTEIFNPKSQNFRLQKQSPALIVATKFRGRVLPAPQGYGIGAQHNYYFSHMLNCLYDCRYCFLQGMYQSAHYVLFVNYEDFQTDIRALCEKHAAEPVHFFSGYDCDSLALEPISGFAEQFLPFFATLDNAWLELRTKSTQIRNLLKMSAQARVVLAFSLSPALIAEKVEERAPALSKRLEALEKLQEAGWLIGLRLDPIIYCHDYQALYRELFAEVFSRIQLERLHSVSLGVFRLPEKFFKKMQRLYPDAPLFASPMSTQNNSVSYRSDLESEMRDFCTVEILKYISEEQFFPCTL